MLQTASHLTCYACIFQCLPSSLSTAACYFHLGAVLNSTLHFFLPMSIYYSNVLSIAKTDSKLIGPTNQYILKDYKVSSRIKSTMTLTAVFVKC